MKNTIKIRRYLPDDVKYIVNLFYQTVHTINVKDYSQEQLDAWAPASLLEDYSAWSLKLEKSKPFVALLNEKIVGFAEFEPNGHIDCFYVHHKYQGMGVGALLMQAINEEAKKESIARIFSEVSITAKPFFLHHGFKIVEQQHVQVRGIEFINFKMEKHYTSYKPLSFEDIPLLVSSFNAIGWDKPSSLFEKYLKEAMDNKRLTWVAFIHQNIAGYVTLNWQSQYTPFKGKSIPEIMDLNVLPYARKMGIGSSLLDLAEAAAAIQGNSVGIGVGLYGGQDGGYGAAQRLYIKRGYIPDGLGVTYDYQPAIPGNQYPVDDDLVLWFSKDIR